MVCISNPRPLRGIVVNGHLGATVEDITLHKINEGKVLLWIRELFIIGDHLQKVLQRVLINHCTYTPMESGWPICHLHQLISPEISPLTSAEKPRRRLLEQPFIT